MKIKNNLFILFCIILFTFGFFILLLINTNPFEADYLTITMFFLTLYIFITGLLTFIGFYYRIKKSNNEIFYANFYPSLRQASLISLILVGLLVLSSLKVLTWWDGIMFSLAIILLELFFQNKNNKIKID